MNFLKKIIAKQRIKLRLNEVVKLIYSETTSFSTEKEQESFMNQLYKSTNKIDLLITYLAVEWVTHNISYKSFYEPVSKISIDEIFDKIIGLTKYSEHEKSPKQNDSVIDLALNLHRLQANRFLRLASHYFINGKKAYNENPYSFEGIRYTHEKSRKKPLSLREQEDCKKGADAIYQLGNQIKYTEELYENKISELKAQAALDEIIQKVKAENNSNY